MTDFGAYIDFIGEEELDFYPSDFEVYYSEGNDIECGGGTVD